MKAVLLITGTWQGGRQHHCRLPGALWDDSFGKGWWLLSLVLGELVPFVEGDCTGEFFPFVTPGVRVLVRQW